MPDAVSPVRRALAQKSTNSPLRSYKHGKAAATSHTSQDSLLPLAKGMSPYSTRQLKPFRTQPSKKRSIDEVEDADSENSQRSNDTQPLSQTSDPPSEIATDEGDMSMDSINDTTSTAQITTPSFHASQEGPGPLEIQFEIPEEMSQKTLDKLHGVAMPQNTSMSFFRPPLLKDTSQVSISMSSLIDFDQNGSQLGSDGLEPIADEADKKEDSEARDLNAKEIGRKGMLDEKAALLRTRLELAFYKVQTNQTSTPFSRLSQRPKSVSPPPQPYSSSPMSPPPLPRDRSYINSPESRIAIIRARATMQRQPPVKPLGDIAMPNIYPTTFSARWRDPERQRTPSSLSDSQGIDSRPRLLAPRFATPSPASKRPPQSPMELSSPQGSPSQGPSTAAKTLRSKGTRYGSLTSSVVKGEAANSLLQLNRANSALAEMGETGGCEF